ncbi:MAG: glyoxylate carboligase [Bifidobacteriaceae bacterium]|jgi:tartronate-semialdehyde synthase|nr:glyoxylate carboligase [Bifidobacteriaceae bacterium]
MAQMTAAEAAVHVLALEGVTQAFGVPGAAINPLYAALKKHGGIKHVLARHVEGASHMADGFGRAKPGNIGVCIGTSGPGGTDMITGLYAAAADSVPLLCITGQVPVAKLEKEDFQGVDIASIAAPVTKMAVTVKEPAQLPHLLQEAFRRMRSGRPGPALIDLPFDVQMAKIEFDPALYKPLPVVPPELSTAQAERVIDLIAGAAHPVIIAGGGVIGASAEPELVQFAELLSIPVIPTLMGWGAIGDDHPLMAGMIGIQTAHRYGNASFLESDLVIGIGNRWANRHTGDLPTYMKGRTFVHIDIEPSQLGKVLTPDLGLVSDAKAALVALTAAARDRIAAGGLKAGQFADWAESCQVRKRDVTMHRKTHFDQVPIKPQRVFEEMNKAFGHDVTYVTTIGLAQIAAAQFLHVYHPRHWINAAQAGPLGWTLPAALGVTLARPGERIVAVSGDYDLQFLIEEIAVAAHHHIPLVYVMLNNTYLGLIRQSQRGFDMDYQVQLDFDNINTPELPGIGVDFLKVMEGLGARAIRVQQPDEMAAAFAEACRLTDELQVPVLVEVLCERDTNIAMGNGLDSVNEFEALAQTPEDAPTEVIDH